MFSNIGSGEILIVLVVLFLLFGSKKLPGLAKGLGESGRELKKAKKDIENALHEVDNNNLSSSEENTKGGDQS